MPLFDPSTVPREVCSPAGVADVNALVEALRAQRVERIEMQESPRGFRVSNKARTYCQGQLWRCLDLVEGAETLRLAGHELSTMLMVRAIYETIAAFVHFERKFASTMRPLEAEEDLKRIYEFLHAKTFATRKENLLAQIGENEAVKATQVLNQIDDMKKVYPAARDDYDFLCEFAHPNAFGGYLWFAKDDRQSDVVRFSAIGPNPEETLFWSIQGAHLLKHFADALDRMNKQLTDLSVFGRRLGRG